MKVTPAKKLKVAKAIYSAHADKPGDFTNAQIQGIRKLRDLTGETLLPCKTYVQETFPNMDTVTSLIDRDNERGMRQAPGSYRIAPTDLLKLANAADADDKASITSMRAFAKHNKQDVKAHPTWVSVAESILEKWGTPAPEPTAERTKTDKPSPSLLRQLARDADNGNDDSRIALTRHADEAGVDAEQFMTWEEVAQAVIDKLAKPAKKAKQHVDRTLDRKQRELTPEEIKFMEDEQERCRKLKKGWRVVKDFQRIDKEGDPVWRYYVVYFPHNGVEDDGTTIAFPTPRGQFAEVIAQRISDTLNAAKAFNPWSR